ncbi:MAG TPA: ABC transporter substrate-binding protein, partial [Blastococcus sp.]
MERTQERLGSRLPAWARGWPRRRILAGAAVVLLVVVVAVSCGSGSGGRAEVPVVGGTADAGVDGVRAPSTATGETLRVVSTEIDSLDPQRSYLPGVWNLMRLYTRTLVTYSTEPGSTDELVPDLATDLGTTSEDGLSWTFTLREGVRFENGRPITAQDVKYGIQ